MAGPWRRNRVLPVLRAVPRGSAGRRGERIGRGGGSVRLHRRRDGHPGGAGRPLGETRHLSPLRDGAPSARSRSSLATTTTRSTPNRRLLYRRVTRRVDVRRLRRGPHAGTARPRSGQRGRRRQHAPGRRNRTRRSSSRSSSSAKGGRPKVAPRPPTQTSFARNSTTATSLMRNSIEHSSSSGISARNSTAGLPPTSTGTTGAGSLT